MRHFYTLLATIFFLAAIAATAQWTDGMDATYVIGQPNFTTASTGTGTQGLNTPYRAAIDLAHNKLYVADFENNRVLRYSYPITANQPTAELVFGQVDFTSVNPNRGGAVAANTLYYPVGLTVHNGTLWVADYSNNRVLKFDNAYSQTTNGVNADVVLGQDNFTTDIPNTTQNGMSSPYGLALDSSGRLWVADISNDRVLRFDNAAGKTNGANADGVLGQPDYTSGSGSTTQNTMLFPSSVAIGADGRLWVSELFNHRVIWFNNAAGKSDGGDADGVLGQADFTSNSSTTSQSGMNFPYDVAISPAGRLFVTDAFNSRVLIFNEAAGKSNGGDADNVLGQTNFTNSNAQATQSGMNSPAGVAITPDGMLYVADASNNRVLMFQGPADDDDTPLPVELTGFKLVPGSSSVSVHWSTASEVNNAGFELYRFDDMTNGFKKIASYITNDDLRGLGTSSIGKNYRYKDNGLTYGTYTYKLVDVEFDGTRTEHEPKSIELEEENFEEIAKAIALYPNPANDAITFDISGEATVIEIYSALGTRLFSGNSEKAKKFTVNTTNLPIGRYTCRISTEEKISVLQFSITR